ncbi:MAG: AmmeMemoRadiSam system protein B [Phycisphaerae bacterium]|nr:AmmeMemoRadiSam system protein B [Phycisphaerae bacterium]
MQKKYKIFVLIPLETGCLWQPSGIVYTLFLTGLIVAGLLLTATNAATEKQTVFNSTLAGRWYSDDANILKKEVSRLFQTSTSSVEPKSDIKPANDIIALILPHAGYQYSGRTAAMGIQSLGRQYKRIIVIGPSHNMPMEVLSVPQETVYQTPMGQVAIDVEFVNKLLKHPQFQVIPQANQPEHSTQIQVPLLQYAQKDFKLVLIVAGQCSTQTITKAASILSSLVDKDTLVIASSDFVHYGPNYGYVPFKENVQEGIKNLDMGAYKYIEKLDSNGFMEYREKTGATICGYIPIAILLSTFDKSSQAHLINYSTSGQLTGDFTNSVSYFSIAFSGKWQTSAHSTGSGQASSVEPKSSPVKSASVKATADKQENNNSGLTEEDKKQLLDFARKSIVYFLDKHEMPDVPDSNISERLKEPRAAFVTLKENNQLRGCIGDIFPRQPLYKSVISNAVNAAVEDPRFYPVGKNELKDITIEISALTAPKPIASYQEIRIGIDGVVLKKSGYSAVFLPQVAPEQKWSREEMLNNLSLKAGLPADGWKDGASFLVFQAEVFGETENLW